MECGDCECVLKWNGMTVNAQVLIKMTVMLLVWSLLAPFSHLEMFSLLTPLLFHRGCTTDMSGKNPVDFVLLFLTTAILENIVTETNRYADDYIRSHKNSPHRSRVHKRKPCTLQAMKRFIAIIIGKTVDVKTWIEQILAFCNQCFFLHYEQEQISTPPALLSPQWL